MDPSSSATPLASARSELSLLSASSKKRPAPAATDGGEASSSSYLASFKKQKEETTPTSLSSSSKQKHPSELRRQRTSISEAMIESSTYAGSNTLFVASFDSARVTAVILERIFSQPYPASSSSKEAASRVLKVEMPRKASGEVKGIAFVEMSTSAEAYVARYLLDGRLLMGRVLVVQEGKSKVKKPSLEEGGGGGNGDAVVSLSAVELKIQAVKAALAKQQQKAR
jgi:RNA recognition motif-containing protein